MQAPKCIVMVFNCSGMGATNSIFRDHSKMHCKETIYIAISSTPLTYNHWTNNTQALKQWMRDLLIFTERTRVAQDLKNYAFLLGRHLCLKDAIFKETHEQHKGLHLLFHFTTWCQIIERNFGKKFEENHRMTRNDTLKNRGRGALLHVLEGLFC